MCASVILSGSHGMFRLRVCVDWMIAPWGNLIWRGITATCLLRTGAPLTVKCAVAPESNMA
eukprot:scaffold37874_cov42-Cyclotella_meneghiniana.AAC.8